MNVYLILCYDLYTGNQDFCFYGVGHTENEAIKNARIPTRYEVNEVFEECSIDDIPEEWTQDEEFMNVLKHGYSNGMDIKKLDEINEEILKLREEYALKVDEEFRKLYKGMSFGELEAKKDTLWAEDYAEKYLKLIERKEALEEGLKNI